MDPTVNTTTKTINIKLSADYNIAVDKTVWLAEFTEDGAHKYINAATLDLLLHGLRSVILKRLDPMQLWHEEHAMRKVTQTETEAQI